MITARERAVASSQFGGDVIAALRPFSSAAIPVKPTVCGRKRKSAPCARFAQSPPPRLDSNAAGSAFAPAQPSAAAVCPTLAGAALYSRTAAAAKVAAPRCVVGRLLEACRIAPAKLTYRLMRNKGAWRCRYGATYVFQAFIRGRPELTFDLAEQGRDRLTKGETPAVVKAWLLTQQREARAAVDADLAARHWPATQNIDGAPRAAGYKICVGLPTNLSSDQISAWLAENECPKPCDFEITPRASPGGPRRWRLCLTFDRASQAAFAKSVLTRAGLGRRQAVWWEPAAES